MSRWVSNPFDRRPYRDFFAREIAFCLADGVFSEVENAGGEYRIGFDLIWISANAWGNGSRGDHDIHPSDKIFINPAVEPTLEDCGPGVPTECVSGQVWDGKSCIVPTITVTPKATCLVDQNSYSVEWTVKNNTPFAATITSSASG